MENIHPIFDKSLQRADKQQLLNQKSIVIWMVGLSGSGKSTIAKAVENNLHCLGFLTQLLDGDNLRTGINNNLTFSDADRLENIRRAAEVAKIFLHAGVVTICSFISPTEEIRNIAKTIIGEEDFFEVYINAPFEICENRDVKGLYKKARAGQIKGFTGLDSPFEAPKKPSLELKTDIISLEQCTDYLIEAIIEKVRL